MFCPHCGTRQAGAARFCESCGRPLDPDAPPAPATAGRSRLDRRWLAGGLAALVVVAAVAGLALSGVFGGPDESPQPVAAPAPTRTATVAATATPSQTATATPTAKPAPTVVHATVKRTCGRNGAGDCHLSVRSQPSSAGRELARLDEGDALRLSCQVHGEAVHSSVLGASSTVWSKTASGGYVANVYVAGPGLDPLRITLRRC